MSDPAFSPDTHRAYIALGSNLGDKEQRITQALAALNNEAGARITALSKLYTTAPVGYTDQDSFLNMVCRISTTLDPYKLLDALHKIENQLERERTIRWGPRTIDLDILLYDDLRSDDPDLAIPHPRMFERAFVMVPLADIYHADRIANKTFAEIIANCADRDGLVFYKTMEMRELVYLS